MSTIRIALITTLVFSGLACLPTTGTQQAKALIADANRLLEQESKVTQQWSQEYGRIFTPENRAKFPSNRESITTEAQPLMKLLDESARLNTGAAEKFEKAATLVGEAREQRGMILFAASLRKNVGITDLVREQLLLASNDEIKDQRIFNETFMNLLGLIQRKTREVNDEQNEARGLMGL